MAAINNRVLVLNQNYEPFAICTLKRAIILIYLEKVHLVERYNGFIHSVSMQMPRPSVIRLNRYIHKPFKRVILNRKNVIKRDHNTCQYCGKNSQPMTVDHVIPKSVGGTDIWENLVCACTKCNIKKGNRTPQEAGMMLQKDPGRPSYLFFLQSLINKPHKSWKPYLFMK